MVGCASEVCLVDGPRDVRSRYPYDQDVVELAENRDEVRDDVDRTKKVGQYKDEDDFDPQRCGGKFEKILVVPDLLSIHLSS